MMGLVVENTPANYELRVGEMALRDNAKDFATATPTIKKVEILVVVTTLVTSRCSMLLRKNQVGRRLITTR